MRALVTGAGGFVGSHLVGTLLKAGHDVEAWIRPGGDTWRLDRFGDAIQVREVDLRDGEAIDRAVDELRPEWIFHLAAHGAYSWQRDSERIMQTNLVAFVRLLSACERHGFAAFVNTGSSSEYGFQDHAPRETELVEPNSDYAVMKAAATLHGRFVSTRDDMHIVTLRLYSVFGPWEEPGRLMPTLVARGLEGRLPPLVAPDTPRDFVSTRDVDRAFLLAAERTDVARGSVFNIGSGRQTTLREVVEVARAEMGITAEPEWGTEPQRQWDATVWVSDPSRAAQDLGWVAEDDVATGFAALADWLREHPENWPRFNISAPAGTGRRS
ncbi:MAG: NAD-dependent epimerase/dehydratase family protein [Solirubrobacteraceae bacterium]|nr:NAD-dependent epimerase/dehydratase family protein [Solirubrobacteraceae bacterium]